jgi:hypothetical protein
MVFRQVVDGGAACASRAAGGENMRVAAMRHFIGFAEKISCQTEYTLPASAKKTEPALRLSLQM